MASQICLKKARFLLLGHERGGLRCGALDHVTLETQSPRASLKHVVAVPAGLFDLGSLELRPPKPQNAPDVRKYWAQRPVAAEVRSKALFVASFLVIAFTARTRRSFRHAAKV
ncbi:unnamed protein product [Protopolystoma xenopodis]|uniref:Uncharacterized protein n=1 Tax=Protopolystoma xenopodis TaxID=117903 RepID=A0A3S5A982_9PLAT|nr:unnamed protein product [Protopolystoma xenopodis]